MNLNDLREQKRLEDTDKFTAFNCANRLMSQQHGAFIRVRMDKVRQTFTVVSLDQVCKLSPDNWLNRLSNPLDNESKDVSCHSCHNCVGHHVEYDVCPGIPSFTSS